MEASICAAALASLMLACQSSPAPVVTTPVIVTPPPVVASVPPPPVVAPVAAPAPAGAWGNPKPVTITGYTGFADEPFISRDGKLLFWNSESVLHYAQKVTDVSFNYIGPVQGMPPGNYNGVPSMDNAGNLYFVNAQGPNYRIWRGTFKNGAVLGTAVLAITGNQPGQDAEISADGNTLYYMVPQVVNPKMSQLAIAKRNADGSFTKQADTLLANIVGSERGQYGADVSADELELYFTGAIAGKPGIYVSTRTAKTEPWGVPTLVVGQDATTGGREATSISPDGKRLYYGQQDITIHPQFMMHIWVMSR